MDWGDAASGRLHTDPSGSLFCLQLPNALLLGGQRLADARASSALFIELRQPAAFILSGSTRNFRLRGVVYNEMG